MDRLRGFHVRLRAVVRPSAADRELHEEMSLHVDLETERHIRAGVPPDEARRRALAAFGGMAPVREAHRDVRGGRLLEETAADARYALRTLRRSPALAVAAIITLALGIGANAAIFSTVNAVLLRDLPVSRPDRLVMLWEENPERGWKRVEAAPANYLDWAEQVSVFEGVAAYPSIPSRMTLTGRGEPRLVASQQVTGNFFDVLGVRAALGRMFRDEETWGTALIVVLSHRFWRDEYGTDVGVVGKTIELSGHSAEIVGVAPDGFALPGLDPDVWRPLNWSTEQRAQLSFRRAHWLRVIARLRPGTTLAAADAELQTVIRRLQQDYPATNTHMGGGMTPLHEFLVGDTRRPLVVLLGAVTLLLLIACANVGNLLLVRAAERQREAELRLALGARRSRLVRQEVTHSLILSGLGGAAGIAVASWGTRALAALRPEGLLPVGPVASTGRCSPMSWRWRQGAGCSLASRPRSGSVAGAPSWHSGKAAAATAAGSGSSGGAMPWSWERWPSRSCSPWGQGCWPGASGTSGACIPASSRPGSSRPP
jgi:predicted permease